MSSASERANGWTSGAVLYSSILLPFYVMWSRGKTSFQMADVHQTEHKFPPEGGGGRFEGTGPVKGVNRRRILVGHLDF